MRQIIFVTGNELKLRVARAICEPRGLTIAQTTLDITEIQSEDGKVIARDKAEKAFAILKKPLIVSDDIWEIPGLGGFPGPYMKFMNQWLSSEDFLRLTLPLTDRRIILRQVAAYQDEHQQKVFTADIEGRLLKEIRGRSTYPHLAIVSFSKDGQSVAEMSAAGKSAVGGHNTAWHELADWLTQKVAA